MESGNSEVRTIIDRFLNGWCKKNKEKIALLKLTGSLEDYLVKELAYQFLTDGFRVYLNMGAGRRKIDMCIISGTGKNNTYQIRALIEAKYLSNAHWDIKDSAQSGWRRRYNTLIVQLKKIKKKNLSGIGKKLTALHPGMKFISGEQGVEVYGLVFVGAVVGNGKDEGFLKSISDVVKDDFNVGLERIFEVDHVGFYGAVCEKK